MGWVLVWGDWGAGNSCFFIHSLCWLLWWQPSNDKSILLKIVTPYCSPPPLPPNLSFTCWFVHLECRKTVISLKSLFRWSYKWKDIFISYLQNFRGCWLFTICHYINFKYWYASYRLLFLICLWLRIKYQQSHVKFSMLLCHQDNSLLEILISKTIIWSS